MFTRHPRVRKTIKFLHEKPVPIVADAVIATEQMGDGRLIPLVILDTTDRPDLEEFVRIHQYADPGDAESQWATLEDGSGKIGLLLSFKNPMEIKVVLTFDPATQGGLIDQIIQSKGLYIQAGKEGDRLIKNPNAPKVIVEIPETGFAKIWDEILFKAIIRRMRLEGLTRREAKQAAKLYISNWREFGSFRMTNDNHRTEHRN